MAVLEVCDAHAVFCRLQVRVRERSGKDGNGPLRYV